MKKVFPFSGFSPGIRVSRDGSKSSITRQIDSFPYRNRATRGPAQLCTHCLPFHVLESMAPGHFISMVYTACIISKTMKMMGWNSAYR